eukprot:483296-Prymnesium_polylepis.1
MSPSTRVAPPPRHRACAATCRRAHEPPPWRTGWSDESLPLRPAHWVVDELRSTWYLRGGSTGERD